MSITLVMPSNHLILCYPLLLPPSIFLSIRVYSNESVLCIRWPEYWSFSFNISPAHEYPGLIFLPQYTAISTSRGSGRKPWSHPWLLLSFIRLFLFSNYVQKLSPAHCLHGAPLVRTSAIPHLLPALPPTAASQHFGWSDRFMCESHHLSRPRNERQSHRGRQGPTRSHVQHSLAQSAPNTLLS